jgi:hypothetical protein
LDSIRPDAARIGTDIRKMKAGNKKLKKMLAEKGLNNS